PSAGRTARLAARSTAAADARPARAAAFLRLQFERSCRARAAAGSDGDRCRVLPDLAGGAAADCRNTAARGGRLMAAVVEARDVSRLFPMPAGPVTALSDVSLRVERGDYIAITGPSGCGKSTLLHLIGCVDSPSSGAIFFEDRDVA